MRVWTLWHGGSSYSVPYVADDTVECESLKAACDEHWRRECGGDPYYPAVDGSETQVFFYDPREVRDPYPDRIITIGPRGGVRVERV